MSKTKKIISIVLAAVLVMAMATVAVVSASAATTVYFENSEGWAEVYAYVWDELDNQAFGAWPGTLTTNVEGNIWTIDIPDDCTHVIFTAGSSGPQTNNLDNPGSSMIAKLGEGTELNDFGQPMTVYLWEAYGDADTEATTTEATTTEATTTVAATTVEPTEAATTAASEDEPTPTEVPTTAEPTEAVTTEAATTEAATTAEPTEAATTAPEAQGIIVGGEEYMVADGAEFTYVATLKTPKEIEDVQGYVTYDASKLTLIDCNTANLGESAIVNTEAEGVVYFNASVVKGLDFTTEASLIEITFKANDASYSEINLVIEEMTEKDGDSYFTDSEQVNDSVSVIETLVYAEENTTTAPETTVDTTPTTTAEMVTTVVGTTAKTDETSKTDAPVVTPDAPVTGANVAIYAVLAVLVMAAAAVVVLRKKVNG